MPQDLCALGRLSIDRIAETQQALFEAHLNGTPPPLSQASPLPVSEALEHIVQRCMAKDPSERYGSTQALLEALAEATTEPGV